MTVIFPPSANRTPRRALTACSVAVVAITAGVWYWLSPAYTDAGYMPQQPVAFSHKLHAGDLHLDCRYCHDTVERAAFAAIPTTQTCMGCHERLVLPESPRLAPVRAAWAADRPLRWVRVHMLPDHAYFDHSVHLTAGVGCATCHGRVDRMKVTYQVQPLSMSWCLDCHRAPEAQLRPRDKLTDMAWDPVTAGYDARRDTTRRRAVAAPTHCSGCHR